MCKGVRGCAKVCQGVRGCARVGEGVQGCARACTNVKGCARVCESVRECARVCGGKERTYVSEVEVELLIHESPLHPTVGPCLGPYGGPRGDALSYARDTPVPCSRTMPRALWWL